jgi:hypothetical protein
MKVKEIKNSDASHFGWAIKCPGCSDYHIFDKRWTFNGDVNSPTFRASMLATVDWPQHHPETGKPKSICHSFVTDGKIQFLSDCTHSMKNQTVDLPDIDPQWNEEIQ